MEIANAESLYKLAEVELIYRNKTKVSDRPKVQTSREVFRLLKNSWDDNKIELLEQFKIVLTDRRNACIGIADISTGGVTGCVADPKIMFAIALKARATGMIMAHNHPSGALRPSQADIELTQRMVKGGKYLDIAVLDHLIVTSEDKYYSFSDEGMMPN
jgi:DNA repair protein RadC